MPVDATRPRPITRLQMTTWVKVFDRLSAMYPLATNAIPPTITFRASMRSSSHPIRGLPAPAEIAPTAKPNESVARFHPKYFSTGGKKTEPVFGPPPQTKNQETNNTATISHAPGASFLVIFNFPSGYAAVSASGSAARWLRPLSRLCKTFRGALHRRRGLLRRRRTKSSLRLRNNSAPRNAPIAEGL
jgi:hypothetical protein